MGIEEYITIAEAIAIMGLQRSQIALLCREGKLAGARKAGPNWLIPRTSAETYTPGPRGFAAHPEKNPRKRRP